MTQDSDLQRHRLIFGKLIEQVEKEPQKIDPTAFRPALTISRTTGARAVTIARKLADYLDHHDPSALQGWSLYDKDLVDTIIKDHRLPPEVMRYMPEDRLGVIQNYVEGLMVGSSDRLLFGATVDTIRKLGYLGHTIIVGRGGNIINRELPNCYHVRMVGSMARRVEHVQEFYRLDELEAREKIATQDRGRERYVKSHFQESVSDPTLYHLTVNTDHYSDKEVVLLIAKSLLTWAERVAASFEQKKK